LEEYNKKYDELSIRYEKLQTKQEELLKLRSDKQGQALKMKSFLANLTQSEDKLDDWNESPWMLMVDSATVHRDSSITFRFNNGKEIRSS
jgi:hypothetical protein